MRRPAPTPVADTVDALRGAGEGVPADISTGDGVAAVAQAVGSGAWTS